MQYENQILKSELEAEHFILTQMAELGKVRNVQECQVAINNLLEKIGHFLLIFLIFVLLFFYTQPIFKFLRIFTCFPYCGTGFPTTAATQIL